VTVEDVLRSFARQWCGLLAWGAPVQLDEVKIGRYNGTAYAGRANNHKHWIIVLTTGKLATDAATVLHELAHLAAPNSEHHGAHWRQLYTRAAAEAFGVPADTFDASTGLIIGDLDEQIREAAYAWLKRTGQLSTLKMIGVV
jgi:hypothetical protein